MKKKSYFTVIALIIAGIFITLAVFWFQTLLTQRPLHAIMVVKSQQPGFEFWELVKKGAKEGAKEFNVELTIDGPMSEEDTRGQIDIVLRAIEQNPDVLILAPVDQEALLPYADMARQRGIDLILVDSALSEPIENCFVGTNNYEAARYVGTEMAEMMHGQGVIAVISHQQTTSTSCDRIAGFENAIKNYPDITIAGIYDIGDSVTKSYETAMQLLATQPEITGIFATNQISAEGVTAALSESGRQDIQFFAFDTSTTQNEALEQGTVDGFAVQMAFNMGYTSVKAAVDSITGALRKTNLDTGFAFATKENMREEEIQKLIYPFA